MIIALTGNIGAGKSTAAKVFAKHGFKIINADLIGHELYKKTQVMRIIVKEFGQKILSDGQIDRRKLKDIVFYDSDELKKLNSIMHPLIIEDIKKKLVGDCVIEGALIFEAEFSEYDYSVLITIEPNEQKKRLLKKGKYSEREIDNILKSQMDQELKMTKADYVIDNSGTKEELEKNVKKIIKK